MTPPFTCPRCGSHAWRPVRMVGDFAALSPEPSAQCAVCGMFTGQIVGDHFGQAIEFRYEDLRGEIKRNEERWLAALAEVGTKPVWPKIGTVKRITTDDRGLRVAIDLDPIGEEIAELMAKPDLTEPEAIRLHLLVQGPPPPAPWWMPRWLRRLISRRALHQ